MHAEKQMGALKHLWPGAHFCMHALHMGKNSHTPTSTHTILNLW